MKTFCIVPCGKRKIWDIKPETGPTDVRFVYIGPFAKKCREYAEMFHPDSWAILSAKYGFLFPGDFVPEPYDTTFNKKKTCPIGVYELMAQAEARGLNKYDRIIVLGGKNYVSILSKVFEGKIESPVAGLSGMGEIMKKLKIAMEKRQRLV